MARSRRIPFTVPLIVALACLLIIQYFTSASDTPHAEITKFGIDRFAFVSGTVIRMDGSFPITGAGASGAGVTWDFSRHTFSTEEFTLTAQDMANFPEAERFPGATALYVRSLPDGTIFYSFFDHLAGFTEHGEMVAEGERERFEPYLDPITWFTTPITYRGKGSDNFALSSSVQGGESNTTGIISWKADAYGTLKLPNGIYTDVLRVSTLMNEITTAVVNGVKSTTDRETQTWMWFRADCPLPLLTYSIVSDEGGTAPGTTSAMISMVSPAKEVR